MAFLVRYIAKRILVLIPILLVVSVAIFFLIRLTPSDPMASITNGRRIGDETRAALIAQYHLDQSLPRQYFIWITNVFRGNLGDSFKHRQSVAYLLAARLPTTIQLVLMSAVFAVLLAIPAGVLCAVKRDSILDRIVSGIMIFCVSSPVFLNAIVLMLIFALRLRWFPAFGAGHNFGENLYYLALPAFALSLNMVALMGRITRDRMIGELKSNYALALTAKGTPRRRILAVHCLKNTLIPVITVAGIQIGSMVIGAVLVENVFALGGIGALLIEGIQSADYPLVQGIIMFLVALFLLLNLVVDIVYVLIDPRIRAASAASVGAGGGNVAGSGLEKTAPAGGAASDARAV
ncbi:oligopeptide transport system permease protein OppB [Treponema primitia ZAS-2]|uniref:Oligopeptide transport system permease protein OppB n=1 Tax=Treponema primitia (strain ATCC BAA-887 / DSM 12427 / ZAS-2) TaxID=545694 RepID=F5YIR9_TREPZ|nr:ABC transporter permease [Treponema primitia]AEF84203.1 oligopeptide transport system permease protein OppB [Treponema primitia ZAS-2]